MVGRPQPKYSPIWEWGKPSPPSSNIRGVLGQRGLKGGPGRVWVGPAVVLFACKQAPTGNKFPLLATQAEGGVVPPRIEGGRW